MRRFLNLRGTCSWSEMICWRWLNGARSRNFKSQPHYWEGLTIVICTSALEKHWLRSSSKKKSTLSILHRGQPRGNCRIATWLFILLKLTGGMEKNTHWTPWCSSTKKILINHANCISKDSRLRNTDLSNATNGVSGFTARASICKMKPTKLSRGTWVKTVAWAISWLEIMSLEARMLKWMWTSTV